MSHSQVKIVVWFLTLSSTLVSIPAFAIEEGALSKVEAIYVPTTRSSSPYVTFKSASSMPGCHGSRGGYLIGDDIEKAYSALLVALKSGSNIRPYYQLNAGNEGWSKCYIKAISVY